MQIKTAMSYHLTPVRVAIIKNLQTINAGEGVEKREPSCQLLVGMRTDIVTMENSMEIALKIRKKTTI